MKKTILQFASGIALIGWALIAQADELNLRPGVTDISREVYDLHMLILGICVAIGVVVFGVLFWSVYAHRKSRGQEAAQFHHSTKLEIAWTIVPTIILVLMAIPSTQ
ncbi:MAG: cytochrome c oxidase subunit II transmembrane domain-containing protein, partial [Pseudomonadota bacterium]|nr:cytochrome c oxidase subunit II transmembrane domain-containing protein [Pseudomonadota bacterium]